MTGTRKRHSSAFKAWVALEAAKQTRTLTELSRAFQVHLVRISRWKRQLLDSAESLFRDGRNRDRDEGQAIQAEDYQLVGQPLPDPAAAPPERFGAGQLDQLLLGIPSDLDLAWPGRLRPGDECPRQPLSEEALVDPADGAESDPGSGYDLIIGVLIPGCGIGQQEDPGVCELACRGLAG